MNWPVNFFFLERRASEAGRWNLGFCLARPKVCLTDIVRPHTAQLMINTSVNQFCKIWPSADWPYGTAADLTLTHSVAYFLWGASAWNRQPEIILQRGNISKLIIIAVHKLNYRLSNFFSSMITWRACSKCNIQTLAYTEGHVGRFILSLLSS